MAIVHCKEIVGRDGEQDMASNKRYVRVFQIITDDPTDGAKQVRDHPDLPNYGDAWERRSGGVTVEIDQDARCIQKSAAQSDGDDLTNWMVTCRYAGVGDPTLEPPKVDWSEVPWQETDSRDIEGRIYANSAGEVFESGFTSDRTRGMVVIEKNVIVYDPTTAEQYRDTLNEVPFLAGRHPPGFSERTCKIKSINAVPVFYPNYPNTTDIHYWRRVTKIEIDRRGWDVSVVDMGLSELIASGGEDMLLPIIAKNGQPTTTPRLLNGAGIALPIGSGPELLEPFIRYETKDWTLLDLEY